MPLYTYVCEPCEREITVRKALKDYRSPEYCSCGRKMEKVIKVPAIIGTADSFGIGKAFYDDKSGKYIDNWTSWEKAGYRDARDSSNSNVADGAKRKAEKIEKYDTRKRFSIGGKK